MNRLISHHLNRRDKELNEVYFAMSIKTLSFSLISIFIPIYLYSLGFSLRDIFFYFAFYYLLSSMGEYLSGRLTLRFGSKHILALSFPMMAINLLVLLSMSVYHWPLLLLSMTTAIAGVLFWVPYHDDFSKAKHKKNAGKEVGKTAILVAIIGSLGPIIGGIIAEEISINVTIVISILILLTAVFPLFKSREIIEKRRLNMSLFSYKKSIRDVLAYGGYGLSESATMVVWPLFIFLILGSYKQVGFIMTFALLVSIAVTIGIGKITDKYGRSKILKVGSIFSFFAYIGRLAVNSSGIAYIVNTLTSVGHIFIYIPFVSDYFIHADKGARTEYIVGMEMGVDFIKALGFFVLLLATYFFDTNLVLTIGIIIGAVSIFLTTLIASSDRKTDKTVKVQKEIVRARA